MPERELNFAYWAMLYEWVINDHDAYREGLAEDTFLKRAKALWEWKGLHRHKRFETIKDELESSAIDSCLNYESQAKAVECLQGEIEFVLASSIVTHTFLLHVADSENGRASKQYPLYDARVWNAGLYLWELEDGRDQLYTKASTSPSKYEKYCDGFDDHCPPDVPPRRYEQALFMFGQVIMNFADGQTTFATIDNAFDEMESDIGAFEGTRTAYLLDR